LLLQFLNGKIPIDQAPIGHSQRPVPRGFHRSNAMSGLSIVQAP